MAAKDALSSAAPYLGGALENEYVHERLGDAATNLRGAYDRVSGRRAAKALEDEKLHRKLGRAIASLREASVALRAGRKKPKRRPPKRLFLALALGAGGVLAVKGDLRARLLAALSGRSGAALATAGAQPAEPAAEAAPA
jgi:hypothetical protein